MPRPSTLVGIPPWGIEWHGFLISAWWSYRFLAPLYTTLGQQKPQTPRIPATQPSISMPVLWTIPCQHAWHLQLGMQMDSAPKPSPVSSNFIFYLLHWSFWAPSFLFKPLSHQLPWAVSKKVLEPSSAFRLPCWSPSLSPACWMPLQEGWSPEIRGAF